MITAMAMVVGAAEPKTPAPMPTSVAKTEAKVFKQGSEVYRYRYRAPKQVEAGKKYPLIVFFHGMGDRGTDNWKQLRNGPDAILDYVDRKGIEAFFLAGQVPPKERWENKVPGCRERTASEQPNPTMRLTFALIDKLIAEQAIDPARVYLIGISMGGFGVWDAVQRRPELFAAAMPMCGGGDVSRAARTKDLPIWCFHGDSDRNVSVKYSRDMVAAIKAAGGKVIKYREYPGMGHRCDIPTLRDDTVYEWLFAQRRQRALDSL